MEKKTIRVKMTAKAVLIALIIGIAGTGKVMALSFTVNNLRYTVNNDGSTVTVNGLAQGVSASGSLVIPESVTYNSTTYLVNTIGNEAFSDCNGFTGSLTIPNTVTIIGESAFEGCSGFTGSLTIPNSVTAIRHYAFRDCSGFTGSLIIGSSVTTIGMYAFQGCSGLTGSLTIPDSVTAIGECAFSGCSGFTGNLIIGNSVSWIGQSAFGACSGFTGDLTIPNSVITIGAYAFQSCSGFTGNLTISNSLTSIEVQTFRFCNGFKGNLTIGNSVTEIKTGAFDNCSGLSGNLTIPNSVITIGEEAFRNCSGFTGNLTISNSVTSIGREAFQNCSGFTGTLSIPNSLTKIFQSVFENCSSLTNLTISNFVTTIGQNAFKNCSGLTGSLIIPNSVTSIGMSAFSGCSSLTNLTIGNSLSSIGSLAFSACSGLEQIVVASGNTNYDSRADCNAIIRTSTNELCVGCKNTVIPNSVTSIKGGAFHGSSDLTSIEIPSNVNTIDNTAFQGCIGLEQIVVSSENTVFDSREGCNAIIRTSTNELLIGCNNTVIPSSVTSIGASAFDGCSGLTSIEIPNSVTSIGVSAFYGCSSLTSIEIPSSVASLGDYAFCYCSGLEQVIVASENAYYDSREGCNAIIRTSTNVLLFGCKNTIIPSSVTAIGASAFSHCSGLTSIKIPNSVTSIGTYAFTDCSGLTSLVIPNPVTSIDYGAFTDCIGLASIVISNSVSSISGFAFNGCSGLTEIIMLGTTPPTLNGSVNNIFGNTNDCPIFVPYESLNVYKTAPMGGWGYYKNRIYPMSYTTIPAYSSEVDNWHFIASPFAEETSPTTVDNMISETNYDLYRFNQNAVKEWENYKQEGDHYHFNLVNGQGYLYANAEETNLIFKGTFNEDETKVVELAYDANADLAGWNLVGNPFPVSAYANRNYYVMNEEGTAIEPVAVSMETAIPACTGLLVKADKTGESVTFSKNASRGQENQGVLQIALNHVADRVGPSTGSGTLVDKAIVSFNADDRLEKFVFNKDNAQLYIPRGKNNYAIVDAEKTGEMPLSFEAKKNGTYTITVDTKLADVDYLHLIDNLTGDDVDLLAQPVYTFEAKTTDYASRFRLVFSTEDAGETPADQLAYIDANGNIMITSDMGDTEGDACNASLQVVDVMGRVIRCRDAVPASRNASVSTTGMTPGAYILRLINGDNVRTQKIVVR